MNSQTNITKASEELQTNKKISKAITWVSSRRKKSLKKKRGFLDAIGCK